MDVKIWKSLILFKILDTFIVRVVYKSDRVKFELNLNIISTYFIFV